MNSGNDFIQQSSHEILRPFVIELNTENVAKLCKSITDGNLDGF